MPRILEVINGSNFFTMKKTGVLALSAFLLVAPLFAQAYSSYDDRFDSDSDRHEGVRRLELRLQKLCEELSHLKIHGHALPTPLFCKFVKPKPPTPPAPAPKPVVTLSASPVNVLVGSTTTLTWQSTNATRCDASNGWTGQKTLAGNETVTVNATSTYAISCGSGTATTSAQVTVNALPQIVTPPVATSGNITVTTDPSSPNYQLAAGGTTGVTLGVLRFRATNENANLYRVGLQLTSGTPNDLSQVYLYSSGGSLLGTATFVGTQTHATSTFGSSLLLSRDTDVLVIVKADIPQVQPSGGVVSGDLVKLAIDTNGTNTQGTGANSGSTINATGSGEFAGVRILRSYPIMSLDTLPSTGIADGRLTRFKITASSFGSIGIARLVFTNASTSVSVQNIQLFGFTDSAYSQPISGQGAGGQVGATDVYPSTATSIQPNNPVEIPAGSTYYFELRGAVSGIVPASSFTSTLRGDVSFDGMKPYLNVSGTSVWTPNTLGSSVLTDADFTNGFGVPGLSSAGISRTRTN